MVQTHQLIMCLDSKNPLKKNTNHFSSVSVSLRLLSVGTKFGFEQIHYMLC